MAAPLTDHFGMEVTRGIAERISVVYPDFDSLGFCAAVQRGFEPLGLMDRGHHIARQLRAFLPESYPAALEILVASLGPRPTGHARAVFFYLPHTQFVASFGLDFPDLSLDAQHALTKRFTAEFSIRPFLIHHRDITLTRLATWTADPDPHVRRLVSEGTRPRLPWATRLPEFQRDPTPVLALLEKLRDDPDLYVRRSVANNLNDIGKDNPEVLHRVAAEWLQNASPNRRWVVNHALRFAVKKGDAAALTILGFGKKPEVRVEQIQIAPSIITPGDTVRVSCEISNPQQEEQIIMADLQIHFVKATGRSTPKVFKLRRITLQPGESATLKKSVSLANLSTRKHYPGEHRVDLLLNGQVFPLGSFVLGG